MNLTAPAGLASAISFVAFLLLTRWHTITHFIGSRDVARCCRVYVEALGGEAVLESEISIVALAHKNVPIQAVCPGATATEFLRESPGTPLEHFPSEIGMTAQEMVNASLAGLDQGEFVAIPSARASCACNWHAPPASAPTTLSALTERGRWQNRLRYAQLRAAL